MVGRWRSGGSVVYSFLPGALQRSSQPGQANARPEGRLGRISPWGLWLLVLILALPQLAEGKKPTGELRDKKAFASITSYCVDTQGLASRSVYEVEGFVKEESKPRRLLTKLPWKLLPDCRQGIPDALVRVEFVRLNSLEIGLGEQSIDQVRGRQEEPYVYRVVLRVVDAASGQHIYKVQAAPLDNPLTDSHMLGHDIPEVQRRNALYNAFWTLIKDLQALRPSPCK
jgi:hypothetical protein